MADDVGVPGMLGPGEAIAKEASLSRGGLPRPSSGGAGLWEDIRLEGRFILENFPCSDSENSPS